MSDPRPAPTDTDCEALLDAAADLLGLEIRPAWRAVALANLKTTAEAARFVESFPLEDELEPSPIFIP